MNQATHPTADNIKDNGPMLNAYPDSIGKSLGEIVRLLEMDECRDCFSSFYILPSLFNTDLDRGFSVISYDINDTYASQEDLLAIRRLGIQLKLDFILNHASVLSREFQDILKNGQDSPYKDFFINWNTFWEGKGSMGPEGFIEPDPEYIKDMFFRKPGLPILQVRMPDGTKVPYWNTFYQEVRYPQLDPQDIMALCGLQYTAADELAARVNGATREGRPPSEADYSSYERFRDRVLSHMEKSRKYLGQMDLNIRSPLVWEFYDSTLKTLASYGADIVRLDAFAYAPKEPGKRNFLNEPDTWEVLERVRGLAEKYSLRLLPEIHASYGEKTYEEIAKKGYMTYDFFLPGLMIDALERQNGDMLKAWALEIYDNGLQVVNMLGCHDGIPLLDLKGLIPEERIEALIERVVDRGGYVKNLHGRKNMYYQVNATFFSALGEKEERLLMARAIQLFMPGKPQIWYLDLFAGRNDHEAVRLAGPGGHKEINRTNLSFEEARRGLEREVVKKQLSMLRFRKRHPAFAFDAAFSLTGDGKSLSFAWEKAGYRARLEADFIRMAFTMEGLNPSGETVFFLSTAPSAV